jgi:hypothetical protein
LNGGRDSRERKLTRTFVSIVAVLPVTALWLIAALDLILASQLSWYTTSIIRNSLVNVALSILLLVGVFSVVRIPFKLNPFLLTKENRLKGNLSAVWLQVHSLMASTLTCSIVVLMLLGFAVGWLSQAPNANINPVGYLITLCAIYAVSPIMIGAISNIMGEAYSGESAGLFAGAVAFAKLALYYLRKNDSKKGVKYLICSLNMASSALKINDHKIAEIDNLINVLTAFELYGSPSKTIKLEDFEQLVNELKTLPTLGGLHARALDIIRQFEGSSISHVEPSPPTRLLLQPWLGNVALIITAFVILLPEQTKLQVINSIGWLVMPPVFQGLAALALVGIGYYLHGKAIGKWPFGKWPVSLSDIPANLDSEQVASSVTTN